MQENLQGGDALLSTKHSEEVVSEGVSDVLGPVVVGALASDGALDCKSLQMKTTETAKGEQKV